MKYKKDKKREQSIFIPVLFVISMLFSNCTTDKEFKKRQIESLVGYYIINLDKTIYEGYDKDDIKDFRLRLHEDGTFFVNKNYPFIYDSIGTWIPRKPGLDEWNWIYFGNSLKIRCQFADSWKAYPTVDSTLMLNSITPQKEQKPITVIYLDKISR